MILHICDILNVDLMYPWLSVQPLRNASCVLEVDTSDAH